MDEDDGTDNDRAKRVECGNTRGDILHLSHEWVLIRFYLIHRIFERGIRNFRSKHEQYRKYEECHLDIIEMEPDSARNDKKRDAKLDAEISFLLPHEGETAECVLEASDEMVRE